MPKSVKALKDVLKREQVLLVKLKSTVGLIAHKETKSLLKELVKIKQSAIGIYKKILTTSEKYAADVVKQTRTSIKKKAAAKKKAATKKKAAPKRKAAAKKKAAPKRKAAAKKKAAPKKKAATKKKAAPKRKTKRSRK